MKYRFFSRKNGWAGSDMVAKYYYSSVVDDLLDETNIFMNKSGAEILSLIENKEISETIKEILIKLCNTYHNWYYYHHDTIITSTMIYI